MILELLFPVRVGFLAAHDPADVQPANEDVSFRIGMVSTGIHDAS